MLKKFNEYLRDKGIQVESFTPDTPKNTHTTDGKDDIPSLFDLFDNLFKF